MASLASLANLGSVNLISFGNFDGSVCLVRSFSFHRKNRASFTSSNKRWRYVGVCRYSVTTDFIAEQGTPLSLDSSNKDSGTDPLLKAAPKPVLKSGPKLDPVLSPPPNEKTSDTKGIKVIESLGEVLEKAEKLETTKKANGPAPKNGKPVSPIHNNSNNNSKPNASKSVWRKGNPVSTVPKTVNEPKSISSRPPQPPQKFEPKLQTRPSVAPPPVKKPVILKDINAASNPAVKERKPILIDKFASKKPAVDPVMAQAVLAPPKPGKGPMLGKFRDDFRKKGGPSGGSRRRKVDDDVGDEDASGFDVSIPGSARKGRKWSKASRKAARLQAAKDAAPVKVEIMEVDEEGMLTEELAFNLAVSEGEILGYLYSKGIKPDGVQKLSKDMVKMVCREYDVEVIDGERVRVEDMAKKKEILDEDDLDKLEDRPPVLTIMGHVDHGKTTLLDYIRKTKVAASEAGGITQGIGAYKVQVPIDGKPQTCVFLDTPGHEAFGAMRARGARVTDIAVIVVAADDGIRPQTSEAIAHAKAAGVPIIVAINKIDKDGANPDRVIQELSSIGLMPEDWGGDTPMVKISALKGENVDDLLETIMLVAELQELKANPDRNARGTVIEAGLDKSKGPVASFIVQNGTLKRGDVVVCGEAFGKVRALFDDKGKQVNEAGPSIPVQVIGLDNVPLAGDEFEVVDSLDVARRKAELRAEFMRNERITEKAGDGKVTLSSLASAVSSGKTVGLDLHQLNIILKVDVQGSVEAIRQALQVLPQANITLKFPTPSNWDVNTSDVDLASASKAIIFGFNVKTPGSVKTYADNKGVEIRLYKVIYELIDDVRNAMEGLLDSVEEQVQIGAAEVRAVFSSGSGRVAGCMVSAGLECGIGIDEFDDWEEGDSIEAFNSVQKRRTLEEASASISAALEQVGMQR
ncbi:translation initiation factor if-2 chloroplastic [Phtheirospermum japonicum]|uniref:Translation initiation factor IF-2, chloroplastic n=1 Tax=Phtheirospermum japonicum TaxID=374723 RepID=A0A830B379_9LAMI|nr:translation initiation factor if-2 chloroplastic [Phtheirospermum japonicum]